MRVCVCVEGYLDVRCSPSTSRDGNSRRDRKRVVSAFSDYSAICTDSIQVFRYHGLPVEFIVELFEFIVEFRVDF